MKQNMGRLIRYILIINRLTAHQQFVPAEELLDYLKFQMEIRGYDVGISMRTLQRDFKEIEEIFDIYIKHHRYKGYFIEETTDSSLCDYEDLLLKFDLLTATSQETETSKYILPEHHRPKSSEHIPLLIDAIKKSLTITFTYTLVRHNDKMIIKHVKPHFIKESLGLWYLLAIDETGKLKSYGIDRISNIEITSVKFTRDESIDPRQLFKYSYGIWDDPETPIEEVEISYSPLDGKFLKANPLHWSQTTLVENDTEYRIKLNIKITNDFIMALLARSSSIEVIRPLHLRKHLKTIFEKGIIRNK